MFYYHNPLSFAGGATRLPSLELPFSPAQPCKSSHIYSIVSLGSETRPYCDILFSLTLKLNFFVMIVIVYPLSHWDSLKE